MKPRLIGALALAFTLGQFAAASAYAEPAAHFRTAAPQAFSASDLERYGLSTADAARVQDLQAQGYRVQVVTPEEAKSYHAGAWEDHKWWIIGGIIVIVAVAVAASN